MQIRTPSRLHFGLLQLSSRAGRQFGSVGVMIRAPGVALSAEPAARLSAEGPLAERTIGFARRYLTAARQAGEIESDLPIRLVVEDAAPCHAGLGTGTQLALAVAKTLAHAAGHDELTLEELARRVGRGQRSAIGVHGFAHGGLLVDGGRRPDDETCAPLVARVELPAAWRWVLFLPPRQAGLHGSDERAALEKLALGADPRRADALCRLVLLELFPAAAQHDFGAFSAALYELNRRVGECFAPVQGGVYAGARAAEMVERLRRHDVVGVGQSSWGPTIFALVEDEAAARSLIARMERKQVAADCRIVPTSTDNRGTHVIGQ